MDQISLRGRLSFSVGETLLSAWEAGRLAPGDIVLSSRMAGYPGFILYNNLPLGLGEVVTFDRSFGVRVIDSDFRPDFQVDPGRIDTLGEMVPGFIDLGGFEVGFDELEGLGTHSFLNLGVPNNGTSDAVLRMAGLPIAKGKVVVVGEQMGLRITERLMSFPIPFQVRQSGNLADRVSAAQAKDYDFSRPDRWSWEQIRRLEAIHRLFQRNLESSLTTASQMLGGRPDLLFVDQCTMGEAKSMLTQAGLDRSWALDNGDSRSRNHGAPRPATLLLEEKGGPFPVGPSTLAWIEAAFSDQGMLTCRPVLVYSAPDWDDSNRDVFIDCLRNGWKNLLDFRLTPLIPEPTIPDREMVILVLLRSEDESAVFAVVYPFLTLEPYMNLLGS